MCEIVQIFFWMVLQAATERTNEVLLQRSTVFGAATTLCVVKPIVNLAHAKIIEQESILVKFGKRVLPTTDFLAKKKSSSCKSVLLLE